MDQIFIINILERNPDPHLHASPADNPPTTAEPFISTCYRVPLYFDTEDPENGYDNSG
jgi:hypothetical protein